MIARLWCEQLNVAEVGEDDHFFLLGGNSIAATQLTARLRDELGLELSLSLLFEAPTLAGFTAQVARLHIDGGVVQGAIAQLPREQALPQSLAQARLWLLWQLEPGSAAYNIPGACACAANWTRLRCAAAFQALVARHEALRTVFADHHGQPVQRVLANLALQVHSLDLGHETPARVQQLREDEARQPFDLERGPLLRVTLVRQDNENPSAVGDPAPHHRRRLVDEHSAGRIRAPVCRRLPEASRRD
ncbi:condensation domain-containing protein [Pseudomonas qingdaonensis]|nr:condensation domain-containing protein [Pseudomonas qingdaonensis]